MGSTLEHTHILIVTNRFWRMYYWRKVQKKPGDWIVILSTLTFLLQKSITLGNEKKSSHEILKECVDVHLSFVKSWNSKYENWSANHTITKKNTTEIIWIKLAAVLVFYLCHIALNKINRFFFGVLPSPHVKSPLLPLLHHSCSRTIGKTFSLFIYSFTDFNLA